jgi:hypothetical protein
MTEDPIDRFHPCSTDIPQTEYMFCYQKNGDVVSRKALMITADEAYYAFRNIVQGESEYKAVLINIVSGAMYPVAGSEGFAESLEEDDQALSVRVQTKILNGWFRLTPDEELGLLLWCEEGNKWEEVNTFIQAYVCAVHPDSASAFGPIGEILGDKGEYLVSGMLRSFLTRDATNEKATELLNRLSSTHRVDKEMIQTLLRWRRERRVTRQKPLLSNSRQS